MDCTDIVYHKNKFGSSRKCCCQNAIHLTFGNISLYLDRDKLQNFALYIAETLESEGNVDDPHERSIYLPTRDPYMMVALSYSELTLTLELLENTMMMVEIERVLE